MEKTTCRKIRDCVLYHGDCLEMLETIPPGSVNTVWTKADAR